MSLEAGNTIKQLVATNPEGTDPKSQGDDHLRLIKATLKNQFSGFTDGIPITRTESQINSMLLKGAYGLGSTAIPFADPNTAAGGFESGFYFYNGGGANLPPVVNAGDTMLQIVTNSTIITQLWTNVASGQMFDRTWFGGVWSAWKPVLMGFRQTGPRDTTPNALTVVGAFGWGASGESMVGINIDAVQPINYVVGIQAGGSGTFPPGAVLGDMLQSFCFNANRVMQVYFAISTGITWTRQYNPGWSTWVPLNSIGTAQGWADVTGARAVATTYQNQTGRPIQLSIGGASNGAAGAMSLTTNAGVLVARCSWSGITFGNYPWTISAIIPPAALYQLDGAGLISQWAELR